MNFALRGVPFFCPNILLGKFLVNSLSSNLNNSLFLMIPRVPTLKSIGRPCEDTRRRPTGSANIFKRSFQYFSLHVQKASWCGPQMTPSSPPTDGVRFNAVILEKQNHTLFPFCCYLLLKFLIFEFLLSGWLGYQSLGSDSCVLKVVLCLSLPKYALII